MKAYENSLKYYRDLKNVIDTARDEGRSEGAVVGERRKAVQTAQKMLQKCYAVEEVSELTGLSVKEIEKLTAR